MRLARPEERRRWDGLADRHHYLGFKRFAGRGLRYVFEWRGQWVGLAGWQSGAFKCRARDRWIGWTQKQQFRRLHLIANNTRFLVLGEPGVFVNLASFAMAAMTRRLSTDWQAEHGHPLLLAETFVETPRFSGAMYKAANWMHLGRTRGFARANGRYTEPHGVPKELYGRALSRDARRRLRGADALPAALAPNPMGGGSGRRPPELRSLYDELMRVPDFRRAQGRKHTSASVLAVHILALLADMHGCLAAAQYAKSLNQTELEALGAWHNPKSGRFVPVSKSTLHRVVANADPAAVEAVLRRYAAPRLQIGQALATDGKRIRGANRNVDGHFETATIVAHGTGVPFASLNFHDEDGEVAAVRALLDEVPVAGRVITIDALHTVRDTARAIVETHGADYLMTVKRNAQETFRTLETIDWEKDATGGFDEAFDKAHGRIERRRVRVLTPLRGTVNYPHLSQVFRVERLRIGLKSGTESTEFAYGITSVPQHKGTPGQLLAWNRGHWGVENKNHRTRDLHFEEDACLARTDNAPANNALCNGIALAVILDRGHAKVAQATRHFARHRGDAFRAVLSSR